MIFESTLPKQVYLLDSIGHMYFLLIIFFYNLSLEKQSTILILAVKNTCCRFIAIICI